MDSTTKSLELAVSFRIFKINYKLIGWGFLFFFWGGGVLFVLFYVLVTEALQGYVEREREAIFCTKNRRENAVDISVL